MKKVTHRAYSFGRFRIDLEQLVLLRNGEPVSLTPKAFATLQLLVENRGRVVNKSELMKAIWPDTAVEENNLAQCISMLRRALDESGGEKKNEYIETIPRRGYRFVAPVAKSARGPKDAASGRIKSVVVLPFQPLQKEGDDGYLGLGFADDLIANLGNTGQIRVLPTRHAVGYGHSVQDLQELGVDSAVIGTFERIADKIRVWVELVRASDESTLWVGKFDGVLTDIFALQDSISQSVSEHLIRFAGQETKRRDQPRKRATQATETYQLYLRGQYCWNKRTEEGLKKAIEYFKQAIKEDPDYSSAYSAYAGCHCVMAMYGLLPPKDAMLEAKTAAAKAVSLDETLAEAHIWLGMVERNREWNWAAAERQFRRALALDPESAAAHNAHALMLIALARKEEALAEIRKAQKLDPASLVVNTAVGELLYFAGDYAGASEELCKTLELEPNFTRAHLYLGLVLTQQHKWKRAADEFRNAITADRLPMSLSGLGCVYALSRPKRLARKILTELKDSLKRRYASYEIALIYAALGENDRAIESLKKAYEQRSPWLIYIKCDPRLDTVRSDPRLQKMIEDMNFPS